MSHMAGAFTWVGSSANSVARVHMFPMFADNYGYLVEEPGTKRAACVDPGDGTAVLKACDELGLDLVAAWCTHKHGDHVGGLSTLLKRVPDLDIVATRYEAIPHATTLVGDGDVFSFGNLSVRVLYTPCHTAGHILFYISSATPDLDENKQPVLFCGDTLFVGGCGRFFEGSAEDMQKNMNIIRTLPESTQVFCAHEYTEGNYKFLNSIDSDTCGDIYKRVKAARAKNMPTVPSTLGAEFQYNLFTRCEDTALQAKLGVRTAVEAMHTLRQRKNAF